MPLKNYHIREKRIFIYAAGSLGKLLLDFLQKESCKVEGFIDKRAKTIKEYCDLPVYDIYDLKVDNPDDYVIIVSVRNVFEHTEITIKFKEMGFYNIIFKPINILRGLDMDNQIVISNAHTLLFEDRKVPDFEIPNIQDEKLIVFRDDLYVKEVEGSIVFRAPVELLFTNIVERQRWSQVNFLAEYLAVDLYQAFDGQIYFDDYASTIDRYIDEFALPGAKGVNVNTGLGWKQTIIRMRKSVFDQMVSMESLFPSFFVDNCPFAQKFDKGFYLTSSGKNRVSFLIARKYKYIPIRIPKEDYISYLNDEKFNKVIKVLEKRNFPILFAPIPHPKLVNYMYEAKDYTSMWLASISRTILRDELRDSRLKKEYIGWGILQDCGVTKRFLSSIDINLYMLNEQDELDEALDDLFDYKERILYDHSEYLFGLIDGFHYNIDICSQLESHVRKTKKFIFVFASIDRLDFLKIIEKSGFNSCIQLFTTVWDGEIVNAYCYER